MSYDDRKKTCYTLTIYEPDARTSRRVTRHATYRQAIRSRDDYERRQGRRYPSVVTRHPMPSGYDAAEWDAWRISQGYSGDHH